MRVVRQEHDRQGRVSADRGDRGAVHPHPRRPVELARIRTRRSARRRSVRRKRACSAGSRSNGGGSSARRAEGKSTDAPNIVFSSSVQVVWEKFANYFEVEPRYVPITKDEPYLTPEGMLAAVDENTIGVVADPRRHVQRRVRAGEGARGRARRPPGADRPRHPDPRRRRVGRHSSRRSSIPISSGTSGCRGCTRSARRATSSASCTRGSVGSSGRSAEYLPEELDLQRELPRRQHADARVELLAPGRAGAAAVLQLPAARAARATAACSRPARTRAEIPRRPSSRRWRVRGADRRLRHAARHVDARRQGTATGTCTTCRRSSANVGGRSRRTRCPPTSTT